MITDNTIFVGQMINLNFTILDEDNQIVDVTDATLSISIQSAMGTKKTGTPSKLVASEGKIRYVTSASDLDVPGIYKAQCLVTLVGVEYPSSILTFKVLPRL